MTLSRSRAGFALALVATLVVSSTAVLAASATSGAPSHPVTSAASARPVLQSTPSFAIGMNATLVIGQASVDGQTESGVTATNLSGPNAVEFDAAGDMWVLDADTDRALEYKEPLVTGEAASVVIGQPSMTSSVSSLNQSGLVGPSSLAISPSGDLWISDWAGQRVLEYVPPFTNGMNASVVLGQYNFNTSYVGTNQSSFDGPNRIAFDAHGDLWVADTWNDRVLEFVPPFSTGMNASLVIGQDSFTSGTAGLNESALTDPRTVAVSSSMLWVADSDNNRILGFPAPFTTGENATVVLGQPNFNTSGGSGPNATNDIVSLFVDTWGDLWAADYTYNRVIEFTPPFTDFEAPAVVIGQSTFSSFSAGSGAANLTNPTGVAVSPEGTLWVADSGNNRVLGYPGPTPAGAPPSHYSVTFTETGVPNGTAWSVEINGSSHASTTPHLAVSLLNGTYPWTLGPGPTGYRLLSSTGGSIKVNGSAQSVDVRFAAVFAVRFMESGLPAGVNWSVTFNGTTVTANTSTIRFVAGNGSYAYQVASTQTQYTVTPVHGMFTVSPTNTSLAVQFSHVATTPPATSAAPPPYLWYGILAAVAAAVGILLLLLVARRRKKPAAAPVVSAPMGAPVPAVIPPWVETPPEAPPPPPS